MSIHKIEVSILWQKYDLRKYVELRKHEAQRRQEIMMQIIKSRTK